MLNFITQISTLEVKKNNAVYKTQFNYIILKYFKKIKKKFPMFIYYQTSPMFYVYKI